MATVVQLLKYILQINKIIVYEWKHEIPSILQNNNTDDLFYCIIGICQVVPWKISKSVSKQASNRSLTRGKVMEWVNERMQWVIAANERVSSLTSLLTCVSSQLSWLLCVMLCFIWRAIIFSIKYTTCISLSFSEWNFNQRPLHSSDRESLEK